MPQKSFRQALNEALHSEMARDPRVMVLGEDIAGGAGASGQQDASGGAFGVTRGLLGAFGPVRVRDTPISETAFVGAAAGAAMTGLRPVVEIMFVDFLGVCFDQIFNQAAKFRYMFGGTRGDAARHPRQLRRRLALGEPSTARRSIRCSPHIPGLKVVVPSNPYDAKGLLIQAIRDDDPVVFLENKLLYDTQGEVPDGSYVVPFGEANILREGEDLVIVALGRMTGMAMQAAERLAQEGVDCAVVDPRTTSPLDEDTLIEYAEQTGRVVIVDEANPRCGMAADISVVARGKGVRRPEGSDPESDGAAHAGALRAEPRSRLHPRRRPHRRGGAARDGLYERLTMAKIHAVTMPKWGMTMVEGKLVGWLAGKGAAVERGQDLMEVETEKITNVVESPGAGALRRILTPVGGTAPVGALLAVLAAPDVPDAEIDAFVSTYAERAGSSQEGAAAAPAARLVDAGGLKLNVLGASGPRNARSCWSTASAVTSGPGCSIRTCSAAER